MAAQFEPDEPDREGEGQQAEDEVCFVHGLANGGRDAVPLPPGLSLQEIQPLPGGTERERLGDSPVCLFKRLEELQL